MSGQIRRETWSIILQLGTLASNHCLVYILSSQAHAFSSTNPRPHDTARNSISGLTWLLFEQASRSWPPVYVSGQIQLRTRSTNPPLATSLSDYLLRLASSATLPRRTSAPQVRLTNQLLGETLLWILFFLLDRRHVAGHLQFACQDKSKSEISPSLLYLTH